MHLRPPPQPSYAPSAYSNDGGTSSPPSNFPSSSLASLEIEIRPDAFQILAGAIAASVLVPILTFNVIDKFLGRLTVTLLVAVGVLSALLQSGVVCRNVMLGREAMTCIGIYGGVMIVMAGIL